MKREKNAIQKKNTNPHFTAAIAQKSFQNVFFAQEGFICEFFSLFLHKFNKLVCVSAQHLTE